MLKPASSLCNLRCGYCFYHSLADMREAPSHGMMSPDTLKTALEKAFSYADGKPVSLTFQGGEPLLAGKEFFLTAEELIRTLNVRRSPVDVGVQTNGTLLDDEWCRLFSRAGWLVGLSLDGDREANSFRVDAEGGETFDRVVAAAKLLQKHRVEFNVLAVLTRPSAERIERVYSFFRRSKFRHLQFIPVLLPLRSEDKSRCSEWALTPEAYLNFLKKAFSLYMKDMIDGRYTSVRQFDNFVRLANFGRAEQCGMSGGCSLQFVVEGDGSVYPCDFYCLDEHLIGNVRRDSFEDMEPAALRFAEDPAALPEKCSDCKYLRLCHGGGCKRERMDLDKCEVYKEFFDYALPHMKRMS